METRIIGTLEVSPSAKEKLAQIAVRMRADGAGIIELVPRASDGGKRMLTLVSELLESDSGANVLVRTKSPALAMQALKNGARILEDEAVFSDSKLLAGVKSKRASVLVASVGGVIGGREFAERVKRARGSIPKERIIIDLGTRSRSQRTHTELMRILPAMRNMGKVIVNAYPDRNGEEIASVALSALRGADFVRAKEVRRAVHAAKIMGAIAP